MTKSCVKVAFLLPRLEIGGAERVVLRTARGLSRERFDPIVLGLAGGSGRFEQELYRAGVQAIVFDRSNSALALWRFFRWMRTHPCDVLFTLMFHANMVGRTLGRLAGAPVVICSERVVGWESPMRRLLNRLTVHWADCVTTNSEAGRKFWQAELGLPDTRLRVLVNGVDADEFSPRKYSGPAGVVIIGNLARLHLKNDQASLLCALARLAARSDLPPWRCLIGGDGPERSSLERLRAKLGLERAVQFVGHVATPSRFLSGIDVYVQSSVAEGLPNAVLEAMATAVPVVATAVGGTPEVVTSGETGLLVSSRNPEALAGALIALLRRPDTRAAMGAAGRARAESHFSVRKMVEDTEALLVDFTA